MIKKVLWVLLPLAASNLSADPLACVSGAFGAYEALSNGCTVGDYTFSDFSFGDPETASLLPSGIDVQVVNDGTSEGLMFSGAFYTVFAENALVSFVVSGPGIASGMLSIKGGFATGGASATATQSICLGGAPAPDGGCPGGVTSVDAKATSTAGTISASTAFAPVTSIGVSDQIVIVGGAPQSGNSAYIAAFLNLFPIAGGTAGGTPAGMDPPGDPPADPAPEPATMALLGSGLAAIAVWRQRRCFIRSR